jgi:4-amino-4-deoxy-L-arabinose transferase-like glycosyltransferase
MIKRLFQNLDDWAERRVGDPHFLWKLFFAALAVRLGLILLHHNINLISDMLGYHESAVSLLQSGEFRVKGRLSASRPPMYSLFMYVFYYLFGVGNIFGLRLVQCVLGAVTAVLTFKLTDKVFNRKAAVWAGLMFAFYPAGWGYCDLVLCETLFTFFFVTGLIFFVDVPKGRYQDALFAALMLGAATLTRTVLYLFPIPLMLVYLVFYRKQWSMFPKLALFVVTFWLVLVPWIARNERVFDEPLMTTKSGVDFYLYNHNPFMLILHNYCWEDKEALGDLVPWQLTEMERNTWSREAAMKWIKENPGLFLFKGVRMQWNYFGVEREYIWSLIAGYWGRAPRWQIVLAFLIFAPTIYVLMPLFIWGVVYSWKRFPKKGNLLWIVGYFLAITFMAYGFSRHRTPLNPVMMAFAGFALTDWSNILSELKRPGILKHPRALIAIGLLGFFVIGWLLEIYLDIGSFFNLGFTHELWQGLNR